MSVSAIAPRGMAADAGACRSRTRRTMAASVVAHAVLLLWIVTRHAAAGASDDVTEIVVLDPGDGAPAAPAAARAGAARAPSPGVRASDDVEERFRRDARTADVAPDPQSEDAIEDLVRARVAALPGAAVAAQAAGGASPLMMPAGLAGGMPGGSGAAVALRREGTGSGMALALTRGPAGGAGSAAALPARDLPAAESTAPATGGDAGARRQISGALLAGPIADRAILSYTTPAYPEWAKREAVEGTVRLYFVVRPDGTIRENVLVQKTAGFGDFDESARRALLQWRFAPLAAGRTGEQWGTITFQFRLRGADAAEGGR